MLKYVLSAAALKASSSKCLLASSQNKSLILWSVRVLVRDKELFRGSGFESG